MSNTIKSEFVGPLLQCFLDFPLFGDDYYLLVEHGIIKPVSSERCEWTKSKTSLAEYFRWIGVNAREITGGFWLPISQAFGVERGTLRKLAGGNGNPYKPDESKDFRKIKKLVLPYRKMAARIREEKNRIQCEKIALYEIRKLVNEIKNEETETIHVAIIKIKNILDKIVDKKMGKDMKKHTKEI
jgi:hypothetical protein